MSNTIVELQAVDIFQSNHLVLSNVSFSVEKGELVYLVGKTGSGKSSLLKILYGELPLNEGRGMVAGFSLYKMKKKEIPMLRRKLGIVFQDFQLLSDRSVEDNLKFVMNATGWKDSKVIDNRIQDVLSLVGLETKGFKFPHELSGGEQQRVAIARALLNNPDVILGDEPTGNLDPETSEEIMDLLVEITKTGTAVILATHDYALFNKYPARIIRCENGSIFDSKNKAA